MELRADFLLPTALKALTDTVIPAIDPDNQLAQEQAKLIAASLSLVAQRLPLEFHYACHELNRYLIFAEKLIELCQQVSQDSERHSALCRTLASGVDQGQKTLSQTQTDPQKIQAENQTLRRIVSAAVSDIFASADPSLQRQLYIIVDAHAEQELRLERAWLEPQGWETGSQLPDIKELLGQ